MTRLVQVHPVRSVGSSARTLAGGGAIRLTGEADVSRIGQGGGTIDGVVEDDEGAIANVADVSKAKRGRVPEGQTFSRSVQAARVDVGKAGHRTDGVQERRTGVMRRYKWTSRRSRLQRPTV